MTIRVIAVAALTMLALCGCESKSGSSPISKTDFADSSITDFHNLGWLGAKSHPLTEAVSFPDPNDADVIVSPGGLVIRDVINDSPAAKAGLKSGDVIVGVGETWLPIKDDPTLDFMQQVEMAVATGDAMSKLWVLRGGACQSISLANILTSLDDGLPTDVVRFSENAGKGLRYLAGLQNSDGSFGDADGDYDSRLQTTAIAGLSFLSSGDEQFKSNVDLCLSFVATQIDSLVKPDEPKQTEQPEATPGIITMKIASVKIDPLTAAYTAQFMAEADMSIMDQVWMPRVLGILESFKQSQDESGGWRVTKTDEAGELQIDVEGTHTTNQVLLALGSIERKGMMVGQQEVLTKACDFLRKQIEARAAGALDRRVKASLMAGTGAALFAINCQASDPVLQQAVTDGLERIDERPMSPSLNLPGILSTAILARQTGTDNWVRFHSAAKCWLASVQLPDGSFKSLPKSGGQPIDIEQHSNNSAWEAAHYCLLLSMQSAELEKITGKANPPSMIVRNSAGENSGGASANEASVPGMTMQIQPGSAPPPGAKMMQLEDLDEETREKIMEQLKKQGIDPEQIKKSGKKKN